LAYLRRRPTTKQDVQVMVKRRFSSCLIDDEITTCGYRTLTSAKCITVMTFVLIVTSGLGSSLN
jgi:hypothetical protein